MNRCCPYCGKEKNKVIITENEFLITRCLNCSLVYLLNPPEEKEIYEEYYKINYNANDFNENSRFGYLAEIYRINMQRVNYLKKVCPSGKILDIGCGTGLFLKLAKEAGYSVSGIDVSETAIEFAKKEFNLEVNNATLDFFKNAGIKFDIVTLWHVLEHYTNPAEELKKIRNLLNEGGMIFAEVPNFNSLKFKLSRSKWKGGNHPKYHRTFFTNRTLKMLLEYCGFKNIKRIKLSYNVSNNLFYYTIKKISNLFASDTFLDFTAR